MGTTPVELGSQVLLPASNWSGFVERRTSGRVPRRALVTALLLQDAQLRVFRCRMTAISATGALIHSSESLGGGELYLLIQMDGLEGRFIHADIVHERLDQSVRNRERRRTPRYHFGVRFLEFVTDPEKLDLLRCVLSPELADLHGCR